MENIPMSTIKARPTTYKGIQMRSRLEAAYAAHCDAFRDAWTYEPQCFADEHGQYLPDFLVSGEYVEIKNPHADIDAALNRMHAIRASEPQAPLTVVTGTWMSDNRWPGGGYHFWTEVRRCDATRPCHACT